MRLDEVRELKRSLTAERGAAAESAAETTAGPPPATVAFGIVPSDRDDGYRLAVRLIATDDETLAYVETLRQRVGDDLEVRRVGQVRALSSQHAKSAAQAFDPGGGGAEPSPPDPPPGEPPPTEPPPAEPPPTEPPPGEPPPTEPPPAEPPPTEPPPAEPPAVSPTDLQKRLRPLVRGASVAHERVTAGTIGAFATVENDGATFVLSNSHVLADSGRGATGDRVMQPGPYDGGGDDDVIGTLALAVPLEESGPNIVDCALAKLDAGIEVDLTGLDGALTGVTDVFTVREEVRKIGRTTAVTVGRITAVEVDGLPIGYDIGTLVFDNQIEIEGVDGAFSAGGDSGSLIYAPDTHLGIGLLFAGSESGGPGGNGLTYANPLTEVLTRLKATLAL